MQNYCIRYSNRKRITDDGLLISEGNSDGKLQINVCLGTGCYSRGAQDLLYAIITSIEKRGYSDKIDVRGSFCFESCSRGPVVRVGDEIIEKCTLEIAMKK